MTLIGTEPNIPNDVYMEVIQRITNAMTLDDLALKQLELLCCKAFSVHQIPSVGSNDDNQKSRYLSDGFPAELKSYFDNLDGNADPTMEYVLSQGQPFWLTELREVKDIFSKDHLNRIDTALQLVDDSLFLPLFGAYNKRGLITVSFQKQRDFFDEIFKWKLWGLSQVWQAKYSVISNSIRTSIQLTSRESEVLELITFGKTNPEIGKILGISTSTVSGYVKQLFLKLGVSDRVTAALKARSFKP